MSSTQLQLAIQGQFANMLIANLFSSILSCSPDQPCRGRAAETWTGGEAVTWRGGAAETRRGAAET